jgi:hypothetical protein
MHYGFIPGRLFERARFQQRTRSRDPRVTACPKRGVLLPTQGPLRGSSRSTGQSLGPLKWKPGQTGRA